MTRIKDNYEDWNAFNIDPYEVLNRQFWYDTANFTTSLINSIETFGKDKFIWGQTSIKMKNTRGVDYIKTVILTLTRFLLKAMQLNFWILEALLRKLLSYNISTTYFITTLNLLFYLNGLME